MKFLVNNIGMFSSVTLFKDFWKTWNPQYLRWGEEVDENKDSAKI
jgi:hypothetical protein